jgi:Flp pilus assembly protein TadG
MNVRKSESGQAIVLMVISLAVLTGMAALVLDVGVWMRTDRRLQATADAAALAGAQQLPNSPGNARSLALDYANRNGGDVLAANITVSSMFNPNDTIQVRAQKNQPGIFSRILGVDSTDIHASAKARADTPYSVRYVAPMVVSCAHNYIQNCNNNGRTPDFGMDTTLNFDKMGAPGAFGMLNLSKGSGTPGTSEEAQWIQRGYDQDLDVNKEYRSDPGAKFSSSEISGALDTRLANGIPLLFPVFEKDKSLTDGGGQVTSYYIIGWIAFHITSYEIHGNNATLHGYFTEYIAKGILSSSGSGSPNYGVKSIQLIE